MGWEGLGLCLSSGWTMSAVETQSGWVGNKSGHSTPIPPQRRGGGHPRTPRKHQPLGGMRTWTCCRHKATPFLETQLHRVRERQAQDHGAKGRCGNRGWEGGSEDTVPDRVTAQASEHQSISTDESHHVGGGGLKVESPSPQGQQVDSDRPGSKTGGA